MTSIKVKFRLSTSTNDNTGTIYYQITHERTVRQLSTSFLITSDEWDKERSRIIVKGDEDREPHLLYIQKEIQHDMIRLGVIIKSLCEKGVIFTADEIIDKFRHYKRKYTLFHYMESLVVQMKEQGRIRTAETYTAAIHSFKKFLIDTTTHKWCHNAEDFMLDCLTSEIMEAYEAWHKKAGKTNNTISFYIRILRAVYNRAVEDGIIACDHNPFKRVYTGIDKTMKRALSLEYIKKLKSLDLTSYPRLDYARDMFMMSFYLRGISFIDLAFLRKTDLHGGKLTYNRRKTGQTLEIAWTPEMQHIIDKYPPNRTDYLMPIITKTGINERNAYRNAGYKINRYLKHLAEIIDSPIPLTLYVSRHSWASIAKAKGIPIRVISEGMGHDNETTTQIYLASLDTSAVDAANSLIISSL